MRTNLFALLTHIDDLFPIPVTVMIYQHVLPMPVVHLARLRSYLIQFRPFVLCRFAVKMACIFHVGTSVLVHAIFLMIVNVDKGNKEGEFWDCSRYIWKALEKARVHVDRIRTRHIVRTHVTRAVYEGLSCA